MITEEERQKARKVYDAAISKASEDYNKAVSGAWKEYYKATGESP